MKLWDRRSWHWVVFALLMGSWCAGWLWFLLMLTWGMPGVLTMKSNRGALELLEFASMRPYPQAIFATFLFFMLPPMLLGGLRNWWDRYGRARAALVWPLRAPMFWLPSVLWCVCWAAMAFILHDSDGLDLAAMAVSTLVFLATPFFCLNPSTLDDAAPARWWRPGWPGMRGLAMCLALWAAYTLISFVVGKLTAINPTSWVTASLSILDELLWAFVLVVAIATWLNRGHWKAVRSDLIGIWRDGFVGEYVWQSVAIAVVFIALAFPIFASAIQAIFVIPQYEHWGRVTGVQLPTGLLLLRDAYQAGGTLLLVFAAPLGLYFTLVQGRLMRRHGVGEGLVRK